MVKSLPSTNIQPMEARRHIEGRTLRYLAELPVDLVKGIGPKSAKTLAGQGVSSVADLLLTVPRRYLDRSQLAELATAPIGEEVTVGGTVQRFSKRRISRGRTMSEATVVDATGTVRVVWFNPYITLTEGEDVALSGKLERYRGSLQMKAPALDRLSQQREAETGRIVPVYPGMGAMAARSFRESIANAVRRSLPIVDAVPEDLLDRYDLVDRSSAIRMIHAPESLDEVAPARTRLVFDEFLRIQMALRARAHDDFESRAGVSNSVRGPLFDRYVSALPFVLTPDQEAALEEILRDMADETPLHRLLQGEVGSGKTVVVIAALLTSVESGHQGAVMAPTEVLAAQHYLGTLHALREAGLAPSQYVDDASGTASLFVEEDLHDRPVRIGLFTSAKVAVNFSHGEISREQGLAWLEDGTIDIAFGTHALIQPDVRFRSLGITVVDEQHRFGVEQRVALRERANEEGVPDLLLMTATPIPRTLVMALYGDLEVSTIRTMPPGRSATVTQSLAMGRDTEASVDAAVREVVEEGRQVFVVCPLVDDSDKVDARSATSEHARLSTVLEGVAVAVLHGQMTSDEKASMMESFRRGETDVLVATTVIEVGIDVPNATMMVVWNAERFGLSQLHQLRGRVGRGRHPGHCLLVAADSTPDSTRRLEAMVASNDGFELAEVDLEIRGHGTIFGAAQSGAGDLRIGDILQDVELLEIAARSARDAVHRDRNSRFVMELVEEFALLMGGGDEWLARS